MVKCLLLYTYPKQIAEIPEIASKNKLTELKLNIEGMDCEACTLHINGELLKVTDVIVANNKMVIPVAKIKFRL